MNLYRILMAALAPVILLRALWRGEGHADLAERLGFGVGPADLWLHGASLGELASARWLVEAILQARPGWRVLVTANTVTGRQMVRGWALPGVTARLAPLDLPGPTRRVLTSRPRVMLNLEGEMWPTRFAMCAKAGVRVVLVGARMSARSYRGWQRWPALPHAALAHVDQASAQDALSRQHLLDLGLRPDAVLPDLDLKAEAMVRRTRPVQTPRNDRAGVLLAASTHAGEEAALLNAFAGQSRFNRLIIAPRHPARAAEVAALLRAQGLAFGQRSRGDAMGGAQVYLADTLGEMDLWYAASGACFIGGTLADKGGHTPWEPALHGCALLHGPSTRNFAAAFATLDAAGGALAVGAEGLAQALQGLDAARQEEMSVRAMTVLQAAGDADALLISIVTVE